jgi:tetratricopeptide (TPR) repeat protein
MKASKLFLCSVILFTIASCGNEGEQERTEPLAIVPKENPKKLFLDQIKKYEDEMHKSMTLDPGVANIAVAAYDNFVKNYPDDSLAPDFLFKAGEICTANQQYKQALNYYETITKKYPDFKLAPESLYLQGFLLDNYLNEDAKAKIIYQEVITKYPTLSYAQDAKAAIKNLGKSDEDLIKEFEKKNKGK